VVRLFDYRRVEKYRIASASSSRVLSILGERLSVPWVSSLLRSELLPRYLRVEGVLEAQPPEFLTLIANMPDSFQRL
tara:strand:- start:499 stop:729 length:231 start_codon:yes stop_codon:yes gene_type:complete